MSEEFSAFNCNIKCWVVELRIYIYRCIFSWFYEFYKYQTTPKPCENLTLSSHSEKLELMLSHMCPRKICWEVQEGRQLRSPLHINPCYVSDLQNGFFPQIEKKIIRITAGTAFNFLCYFFFFCTSSEFFFLRFWIISIYQRP